VPDYAALMRKMDLFSDLSEDSLDEIAPYCRLEVFEAKSTILAQGIPPGDLYIVCSGSAEVVLDNQEHERVTLAKLEPGEYFGEMSILTGEPTSAAIIASEECSVLAISKDVFARMITLVPELSHDLIRTLSLRLKRVNMGVWEARNKELALTFLMKNEQKGRYSEIVGKSKEIKSIRESIQKLSVSDEPLYLIGEKGTGRELIARVVHENSRRRNKSFFAINCSHQVGDGLFDEKLFGQFGYLELASGGTIFLKHVELLSVTTLRRLALYLGNPLADIRLIFSSTEDIREKLARDNLSADLINKLFANIVNTVSLRQRKKDIPDLIKYYMDKCSRKYNRPFYTLSKDATEKLLSYDYFQGNVTELEDALDRAFLLAESEQIDSEHIFLGAAAGKTGPSVNLLRYKTMMGAIQNKIYPRYFQAVVTAAFIGLILLCFLGPADYSRNPGTFLAWSLGWPSFIFSAVLLGRISCSVCPMSNIALNIQKFLSLSRPIPGFIKKYDYLIITFLFVLILWVEEITGMRRSPPATGLLFLTIVTGAVAAAIYFPRQTWCRHLCPLGGMFSVYSMTSPLELRSNVEICLNKCTTHECYKGSEQDSGCPLFQHVPFIDNNQDCKMCLKCVRSCPNDSVQLNLRPPAREIWNVSRVRRSMVVFVVTVLAVIFPLVIFDHLRDSMSSAQWFSAFTFFYWLAALAAVGATWFLAGRSFNDEKFLYRIRGLYAFVPLVAGLHAAYQARFLPLLPALDVRLFQTLPGSQGASLIRIPVLNSLEVIFLSIGLVISLYAAWKITKTSIVSKYFLAKEGLALLACFSLAVCTLLAWQ
jgi:transcriptional regulator with AAA-type ATPase domain/ferredoxin